MKKQVNRLKTYEILAVGFILFGFIGLLDIVTARLFDGSEAGYVTVALLAVVGTTGVYITALSRIWILWLLLGLYLHYKARVTEKMDQPGFDQKTDRDVRQLRWVKYGLIAVVGFLVLILGLVAFSTSSPNTNCPVPVVGGRGERNYLPLGTIYALTDDPDRHYYIVEYTIHATSDQLDKMVCFRTEAEAEEAGYTKAEVLSNQSGLTQKQVAELYEELKALPREQANAIVETLDDSAYKELRKLRDADAVAPQDSALVESYQIQSSAPDQAETLSAKLKRLESEDPQPSNSEDNNYISSGRADNKRLQYNALENRWEYAGSSDSVKYNALEDRWQYAGKDEDPRYNTFEDRWDFAKDSDSLQYNPFEDNWEYGSKNSDVKYNSFEDRWERTEPGETLQYNTFENRWSYE